MKFKIKVNETTKHTDICSSVRWTVNNEAYSVSDDNTIMKWDPNSLEVNLIFKIRVLNFLIWSNVQPTWISCLVQEA